MSRFVSVVKFLPALCLFSLLLACNESKKTNGETIACRDSCMVLFRPDSALVERYMTETKDTQFLTSLARHNEYADSLQVQLGGRGIRVVRSTARFIMLDNGRKTQRFEARDEDGFPFGVILSRPDGEPMVHYGVFSAIEYRQMVRTYFNSE
jgi:hypothetical protein